MKDVLVTTPVQLFYWLDRGEVVMADAPLFKVLFWRSQGRYHMVVQPGFATALEVTTPERRDVERMFKFWSDRVEFFVSLGARVGSEPAPWWKKAVGRLWWKLMGV
ncbi:hypothetical protein SAMN00808754_1657 [Thermanaeromonas toyohensis ToBE]|uniref:Uncharacterized protein n=1 Tax=Thermanaeromonas toyohensis ToBE TaxID=698762 RepID=A0A1W1VU89_9FIRM|nr:hypothetical protein [Thermanaeromonas toyohensis]SMB96800.1 hypothetical protein SAMN00808754_1657 [Thermanaeromonas toyohensis ToBE]